MQYTINSIDETTGIPNITYTTKAGYTDTGNLANAVGLDVDALNQFIFDFCEAYDAGKAIEDKVKPSPEVTALVGQSMSLEKVNVKGVEVLTASISGKPIKLQPPTEEVLP